MRIVHRLGVLVIAVVWVLVIASCGGGSERAVSPAPATSAVAASTSAATPRAQGPSGGRDLEVATADGRTRSAHLHVPVDLPDGPVPLLVALHGGTGWGDQFERTSGFDDIADQEGVIVAYPDGVGIGAGEDALRTWNGGVCCGPAVRQEVDDVAFLRQLVDQIEDDYLIDPARVFATGHSNGMIMAYRLACEAADTFVAVAGQAGTLGIDECRPSAAVSVLHIHGAADANLPIDGGPGAGLANIDFPSPRIGIATFAAAIGCPSDPTTDRGTGSSAAGVATQTWRACNGGAEASFVTIDGADHGWMGSTAPTRTGTPPPFAGFDTTEAVWAFLAAHPRA